MNVAIVLNYNDAETTLRFLAEVERYASFDRIVVVDNASTDGSAERLAPACDGERVRLVRAETNGGYAVGNNLGVRTAEQAWPEVDTIIVSNPDVHVSDADVAKVTEALGHGFALATGVTYVPKPGAEAPAEGVPEGWELASNFAWGLPSLGDMVGNLFYGSYVLRRYVLRRSNHVPPAALAAARAAGERYLPVDCVPGCFFAARDDALRKVGYLDERTFLYQEETILGHRLREAGERSCVVTDATVLHEHGVSIKKSITSARRSAAILLDSQLVYLERCLGVSAPVRTLYRGVFWAAFVENRAAEAALALAGTLFGKGREA